MPIETPTYLLADLILGGDLATRLTDWRGNKKSYEWIAREVNDLTDGKVNVTFSTVRNWVNELEPTPQDAA